MNWNLITVLGSFAFSNLQSGDFRHHWEGGPGRKWGLREATLCPGCVTLAWINKGPFSDLQSRDWAIPWSSGPGRALEGGQIISPYVGITQAGAESKVDIWDSPAGSRCLESIDFLLCTLDFPLVIGLHQANFKPVKTHYWRSQPWTKPCMWHFWKSGLVLCGLSLTPPSFIFFVSFFLFFFFHLWVITHPHTQ